MIESSAIIHALITDGVSPARIAKIDKNIVLIAFIFDFDRFILVSNRTIPVKIIPYVRA